MICKPCARAADRKTGGTSLACACCGKWPVCVYRTDVPLEEQKVVRHKFGGIKCPGTGRPPIVRSGHDFCTGCDCQHEPVGSYTVAR